MSESDPAGEFRPDPEWARERLSERMEEVRRNVNSLFPPEFKAHVRTARREFWLAVRSLVDARLDAIEDEAKPKSEPPHGRINVE